MKRQEDWKLFSKICLAAVFGVSAGAFGPVQCAEKNPNATLTLEWNKPDPVVLEQVAERFKSAAAHNAKMIHVDVNRDLKGDRLTPEALKIQYQGLEPDGTPVEEKVFHDEEERATSRSVKR